MTDWNAEVARRFQEYPESGARYEAQHREVRQAFRRLAVTLVTALPAVDDKTAILDGLDQVMHRAHAAIDRQAPK